MAVCLDVSECVCQTFRPNLKQLESFRNLLGTVYLDKEFDEQDNSAQAIEFEQEVWFTE